MRDSFLEFADEQVLGNCYWPALFESWSLQLRNHIKMSPQLKSFFFSSSHLYSVVESYEVLIARFRCSLFISQGHLNNRGIPLEASFSPDSKYVMSGELESCDYEWSRSLKFCRIVELRRALLCFIRCRVDRWEGSRLAREHGSKGRLSKPWTSRPSAVYQVLAEVPLFCDRVLHRGEYWKSDTKTLH